MCLLVWQSNKTKIKFSSGGYFFNTVFSKNVFLLQPKSTK